MIGDGYEIVKAAADDSRRGCPGHLPELPVAVEDGAVRQERDGALVHGLDHHVVGVIGPLEGVDPIARGAGRDNGVHGAAADGFQGVFQLLEAGPQLFVFDGQLLFRFGFGHGVVLSERA